MNDFYAALRKRVSQMFEVAGELTLPLGRFHVTAILGPSGSGKTTWLRLLAGLERPDAGIIRFGDAIWYASQQAICLSPQQRRIGFLFQEYALFPHLTAEQNIAFGLQHLSRKERHQRVAEMLALVQLQSKRKEYPHRLSGGEKQRLALAQVLARRPCLLLLDEPFSALDVHLRRQLGQQWREWLAPFQIPVVLVSHDREEVLTLADQVAVMLQGRICQTGSVTEVFNHPKDETVARLIGLETLVSGRVVAIVEETVEVEVGPHRLVVLVPADGVPRPGAEVVLGIRGEDVLVIRDHLCTGDVSARNRLAARVVQLQWSGRGYSVHLDAGFPLTATVTRAAVENLGLTPGQTVTAVIKASAIHLFLR
ncbi:Sulfate/thiosulfate import ATP-binding protein CysA [bacterium HR36]|nr:Sulfate/thiosulfate import ATP-binding protein CysA [bacterium HR36]